MSIVNKEQSSSRWTVPTYSQFLLGRLDSTGSWFLLMLFSHAEMTLAGRPDLRSRGVPAPLAGPARHMALRTHHAEAVHELTEAATRQRTP